MKKKNLLIIAVAVTAIIATVLAYRSLKKAPSETKPLRVAIAPYQDLAMLMTYKQLGLEERHGIKLEVLTTAWEEIVPSLASAGPTFDVGFGSLIEFQTKYENINAGASDPLVFVYPAYVFKGGGFVSFNQKVPNLDEKIPPAPEVVRQFFALRIGAPKNSMFDMMLFSLSEQAGIGRDQLHIVDTTLADGILAAQAGSLDAAAAGLTQRNEALERRGRVVLTMDKFGFADLTGFIVRRSTLESRRADIEKLIRVWFDCVNYVYSNIDKNSEIPLKYLAQKSSTQYTVETYKRALEAEYLPTSVADANKELVADSGSFSIAKISKNVGEFLVKQKIVRNAPPLPEPIPIAP
jgi:ABC-type nitrate/sulfonate/bicarbonate transport system substrate-binding protein